MLPDCLVGLVLSLLLLHAGDFTFKTCCPCSGERKGAATSQTTPVDILKVQIPHTVLPSYLLVCELKL